MITLEAAGLFPELGLSVVVDGVPLTALIDQVEQKRHEISGLMVETMQLTAVALELGPVNVGQLLDVDDVEWEVEAVTRTGNMVVVSLVRNLG